MEENTRTELEKKVLFGFLELFVGENSLIMAESKKAQFLDSNGIIMGHGIEP